MKETNYGVYIFEGGEEEIAARWMWTCLLDLSPRGRRELIWRIITKKPPKWVGLKTTAEYKKIALDELNRLAS